MSRPVAPGSLFLVCLPPDRETIGVPHPEPGRGRRRGGNKDSVLLCLCSSEHGPCGPGCWGQANMSPPHASSSGSPHFALPWTPFWDRQHRPSDKQSYGWEVAEPRFALSTSCSHTSLREPSALTTYCSPGTGHTAVDKIGPCPHGGVTLINKETRT